MTATVYIVRCADDSYYVGSTRGALAARIDEHNRGAVDGYTARRRPVTLLWSEEFAWHEEAFAAERRLKGWSRAKKDALMRGDVAALKALARCRTRG